MRIHINECKIQQFHMFVLHNIYLHLHLQCRTESVPAFVEKSAEVLALLLHLSLLSWILDAILPNIFAPMSFAHLTIYFDEPCLSLSLTFSIQAILTLVWLCLSLSSFNAGNLDDNLLHRGGEEEGGGANDRWARPSKMCLQKRFLWPPWSCFSFSKLRYIYWASVEGWTIGQFFYNHRICTAHAMYSTNPLSGQNQNLCRQFLANVIKFDIAASVIFKGPERSFEKRPPSSFLHVSAIITFLPEHAERKSKKVSFSSKFLEGNNGFNEQWAFSAIVCWQSTILKRGEEILSKDETALQTNQILQFSEIWFGLTLK